MGVLLEEYETRRPDAGPTIDSLREQFRDKVERRNASKEAAAERRTASLDTAKAHVSRLETLLERIAATHSRFLFGDVDYPGQHVASTKALRAKDPNDSIYRIRFIINPEGINYGRCDGERVEFCCTADAAGNLKLFINPNAKFEHTYRQNRDPRTDVHGQDDVWIERYSGQAPNGHEQGLIALVLGLIAELVPECEETIKGAISKFENEEAIPSP